MSDKEVQENKPEGKSPEVHASNNKLRDSVLGTRNLMTVAAIAVVATIILIPMNYIFPVIAVSQKGILIACALMLGWFYPYALVGAITRKPGAIMISALIIGIISIFTTPSGAGALVGNLIGGALVAIGVVLTLYRHWWIGLCISAFTFGGFNGTIYGYAMKVGVTPLFAASCAAIAIASCLVGVGLLKLTVMALNKAGVGKSIVAQSK